MDDDVPRFSFGGGAGKTANGKDQAPSTWMGDAVAGTDGSTLDGVDV